MNNSLARPLAIAAGALLLTGAATPSAAQEYTLRVVEALSLPSSLPEAYLHDVNEAGAAVGFMTYSEQLPSGSWSTSYKAFRWDEAGGIQVELDYMVFTSINNPGDIIIGNRDVLLADGRLFDIRPLEGDIKARVFDINDNGVAGGHSITREFSSCNIAREAIVWSVEDGVRGLERHFGIAHADKINSINNQNQVAGVISESGSCIDFEAFVFDLDSGEFIDLHAMLGRPVSEAVAISDTGLVAGRSMSGDPAWFWDPAEGFTLLPALPGGDVGEVRPQAVTDDGRVVGYAANSAGDYEAFLWDRDAGMRALSDLVEAPADFKQSYAYAINEDGVITGAAQLPNTPFGGVEGFKAWVLVPGSGCRPDLDGDGALTFFDFLAFQNLFAAGDLEADFDGSGVLDFFDFLAFQNDFAGGCG